MPYSLLFVAACCTVCYSLPHAMRYAISFLTLYSFLFIAAHHTVSLLPHACFKVATFSHMICSLLFTAVCRTACYLLLGAVHFLYSFATACHAILPPVATWCIICYLLLLVIRFSTDHSASCSLLFVATNCYFFRTPCNSLPVAVFHQPFVTVLHSWLFLLQTQHNLGKIGYS